MSEVIEGIQILQKYFDKDEHNIAGEYKNIYVDPTDKPISPEDLDRVYELGWVQDEVKLDENRDYPYDPELGWISA